MIPIHPIIAKLQLARNGALNDERWAVERSYRASEMMAGCGNCQIQAESVANKRSRHARFTQQLETILNDYSVLTLTRVLPGVSGADCILSTHS